MASIKIPVIEITQPIDKFYVGKINAKKLLGLAKSDINQLVIKL